MDASGVVAWAIGGDARLLFVSGPASDWIGQPPDRLIGRFASTGAATSDDPVDLAAAALAPPPDLPMAGTARLRVQPPAGGPRLDIRYVRLGDAGIFAVAGDYDDRRVDVDRRDLAAVRGRVDRYRRQRGDRVTALCVGGSRASRSLRANLRAAVESRGSLCLVGHRRGFGPLFAEAIASRRQPGVPTVGVDGATVDAELASNLFENALPDDDSAAVIVLASGDHADADLRRIIEDRVRRQSAVVVVECRSDRPTIDDDLSIRTAAHVCHLPSLADRSEDVVEIATALLNHRDVATTTTVSKHWSRAALDRIVGYPMGGDLEELWEVVRASHAAAGTEVTVNDLPLAVRSYEPARDSREPVLPTLADAVRKVQKDLVVETLRRTKNNRAEAARRLDITRAKILRLIDELGLDENSVDGPAMDKLADDKAVQRGG